MKVCGFVADEVSDIVVAGRFKKNLGKILKSSGQNLKKAQVNSLKM